VPIHPDFNFTDANIDLQAAELYAPCRLSFGLATALPRRAYTSEVFQDLENENVWSRVWVCVGSVHEIPDANDLLPYTIGQHAIHVQRQNDGGLIGRFNKAQHGGCRAVPAQCRTGKKTKCSYTSCGHSRDREVIPGGELGETAALIGQYLGGVPERLLPVRIRVVAGYIFANIDPTPDSVVEPPVMSTKGGSQRRGGEWRAHRSNWKLAAASLVEVARTDSCGGALNHVEAEWQFPNLVRISSQNVMVSVVLQPTAMNQTLWRVSLFTSPNAANVEAMHEKLARLIDRAAERAEAHQNEVELASTDDVTETSRAGWRFNQEIVEHLTRRHATYWNAPLVDATVMARR
jgi:hypothetical protein